MAKCFVVMGFGEKTDYKTSRVLDLNKTYRHIIKKAVEAAGLECIRADEIPHSGTIDVPMYEMLLDADLVIADLSTSNLNAAYELGIRHALKPATTIIIAEDQFDAPFDVNHITVRKYRHDGKSLDIDVVEAFRDKLTQAIKDIMVNGRIDSPVYTFLPLDAPSRRKVVQALQAAAGDTPPAAPPPTASLSELMDKARTYKASGKYAIAKDYLQEARLAAPNDAYVVQQLALVTYKSKQPTEAEALQEACGILEALNPLHSNNAETLGLWGAIHKRLYATTQDKAMLDKAIYAYEKGYRLLSDHYNGINWAFLLNMRASMPGTSRDEAITDFVLARRTRADVLAICQAGLPDDAKQQDLLARKGDKNCLDQRAECYWVLASAAEAALGLGDEPRCAALLAQAAPFADEAFMVPSTTEQLDKLRKLLAESPLRWVSAA